MLYVPLKATKEHWLADQIGLDALKLLVNIYGGETIEIPRCSGAVQKIKERAILEDSKHLSTPALARRYDYTVRGMRKLLRRCESDLANDTQTELFD